jgi:hypothetical protein
MSNTTLIIGSSGSGKSTSLRNLDPESTFILNVLDKPLPFRGYKSKYKAISGWEDKTGNYYATDDYIRLMRAVRMVSDSRPEIKTLILDDFNYIMCNEFMRRSGERGFDKYSEMAAHVHSLIQEMNSTRPDLLCFILSHSDSDQTGFMKLKTIGKLLSEKVEIEGMVTTVFHSMVVDGDFKFLTQLTSNHLAKSPLGMFADKFIDNDLQPIIKIMADYYNEEE